MHLDGCTVPRLLRMVIPRETPEQRAICDTHDLWYNNGGTKRQRAIADAQALLGWLRTGMNVDLAEAYYDGIRRYGKPHWGPTGQYID